MYSSERVYGPEAFRKVQVSLYMFYVHTLIAGRSEEVHLLHSNWNPLQYIICYTPYVYHTLSHLECTHTDQTCVPVGSRHLRAAVVHSSRRRTYDIIAADRKTRKEDSPHTHPSVYLFIKSVASALGRAHSGMFAIYNRVDVNSSPGQWANAPKRCALESCARHSIRPSKRVHTCWHVWVCEYVCAVVVWPMSPQKPCGRTKWGVCTRHI